MLNKRITTDSWLPLLKIGLATSLVILIVKLLDTMLVYHFFSFDKYLTVVAIAFFLAGYFSSLKKYFVLSPLPVSYPALEESRELKMIRYSLTNREFMIFKYLAEGKTNKEISSDLGIEVSTVKTHINNLFAKISCKTRKEAIEKWAVMAEHQVI